MRWQILNQTGEDITIYKVLDSDEFTSRYWPEVKHARTIWNEPIEVVPLATFCAPSVPDGAIDCAGQGLPSIWIPLKPMDAEPWPLPPRRAGVRLIVTKQQLADSPRDGRDDLLITNIDDAITSERLLVGYTALRVVPPKV